MIGKTTVICALMAVVAGVWMFVVKHEIQSLESACPRNRPGWRRKRPTARESSPPVAVGDFDRDGHQDLFWVSGGGGPDKLFINNGDGTFADRAAQ